MPTTPTTPTTPIITLFDKELKETVAAARLLDPTLDTATLYGALLLVLTDLLLDATDRQTAEELLKIAQQVVKGAED